MEPDRVKPRTLTQSGSAFLDVVRFGTAIFVFLGHILFIPGSYRFVHLAHIAVCIFFVLSGFVIRMIATTRVSTFGAFLIDRASRIYSVVLPALAVTILCEALAHWLSPGWYRALSEHFLWSHIPLQLLANLTFMAQNWGYEIDPLSNSPFWSLSFECIYYLLFALFFYATTRHAPGISRARRNTMRAAAVVLMLIAGPSIVLLFPTWIIGCVLYDAYRWLDNKSYAFALTSALLVATFAFFIGLRHQVSRLMLLTDFFHRNVWLYGRLYRVTTPSQRLFLLNSSGFIPWLSRLSLSFYIAAILVFVIMLWTLITLDRFLPQIPTRIAATLRWIAEGTFALYLLHLPLLILIAALFKNRPPFPIAWAAGVVVFCIVLSRSFDRLKLAMRTVLRRAFPNTVPTR